MRWLFGGETEEQKHDALGDLLAKAQRSNVVRDQEDIKRVQEYRRKEKEKLKAAQEARDKLEATRRGAHTLNEQQQAAATEKAFFVKTKEPSQALLDRLAAEPVRRVREAVVPAADVKIMPSQRGFWAAQKQQEKMGLSSSSDDSVNSVGLRFLRDFF